MDPLIFRFSDASNAHCRRRYGAVKRASKASVVAHYGEAKLENCGANAELSPFRDICKGFIIKRFCVGLQRVKWSKYLCNNAC